MTPKKLLRRRSSGDKIVEGFAKVANRSMEPKGVSESMVHFYEIINQENCDAQGNVRAGCLLRWMDICACLSAEKHGMLSSVTLSMDDLTFDMPAKLGDVLEISARVNNAFNTSMEVGVLVQSTGETSSSITHCKAFFTFVSLDHHGKKCKVRGGGGWGGVCVWGGEQSDEMVSLALTHLTITITSTLLPSHPPHPGSQSDPRNGSREGQLYNGEREVRKNGVGGMLNLGSSLISLRIAGGQ